MKTVVVLLLFLVAQIAHGTPLNTSGNQTASSRIIGGNIAKLGQFPYLAAIWTKTASQKFFCAGTLVDEDWILTAGHCVDGAQEFTITLGATNLKNKETERVDVVADTYVVHPKYNRTSLENDIGLIRLREPVMYTIALRPVEMLAESYLSPNAQVIAVGWGSNNDNTPNPIDELNWVELRAFSNVECQQIYGNRIKNEMVCVRGSHNEGTCKGDSGGPLLQHEGFAIFRHVGISSFISGSGCETPEPSGYTRTYPYVDWIKSVILI